MQPSKVGTVDVGVERVVVVIIVSVNVDGGVTCGINVVKLFLKNGLVSFTFNIASVDLGRSARKCIRHCRLFAPKTIESTYQRKSHHFFSIL